jgi:hypothetical protein
MSFAQAYAYLLNLENWSPPVKYEDASARFIFIAIAKNLRTQTADEDCQNLVMVEYYSFRVNGLLATSEKS